MSRRNPQSGVTLIEMLAALAVTALIGIAGFSLLDGVTTRDAQLSGRIDALMAQDRAFRLLRRDCIAARSSTFSDQDGLELQLPDLTVVWRTGPKGVMRRIVWPDRRVVTQAILDVPARFLPHPGTSRAIHLVLKEADTRWLIALPGPDVAS